MNVFPSAVKGVICSFIPETTGEFRIVLDKPGPYVGSNLQLKIERGEAFPAEKDEELAKKLKQAIKEKLAFTPIVTIVPPNSFERSQ